MYHIQATDTRPLRMMIMTMVLLLLTMMMTTTNDTDTDHTRLSQGKIYLIKISILT